jgi:hypothetical protein
MRSDRTYKVGRLQELRDRLRTLKVKIDAPVKAIIYHFEPIDNDCDYVEKIDTGFLEIHFISIKEEMIKLKKVVGEIHQLEEELGVGESGS